MKFVKIVLSLFCISLYSLNSHADLPSPQVYGFDATEEVNQLDAQSKLDDGQIVLSTFANMVQNMVNIALNPHNPSNVAQNIVQMIAGIVQTGVQLSKRLPAEISLEERQQFLNELEECLKKELSSLVIAKKAMLPANTMD